MSLPRYQIFISSTFKDLQEERQSVLNAILKLNQFPAGMEIFPAVDDTAWEHIEKVIKDSDYYVLIIGGKYGSIEASSGLSYTEKEYDFAVSQGIPVLAFTRSDEDSIPVGKAELDPDVREKLKKFKQKVGNKHHWNYWKNLDELKANVISSLSMTFVMNPQKGWVKSGGINNIELLERLAQLQKRYDELLDENSHYKDSLLDTDATKYLNDGEGVIVKYESPNDPKEIKLTFREIILAIGSDLLIQCETREIVRMLGLYIDCKCANVTDFDSKKRRGYRGTWLDEESESEIETQLLLLGVIEVGGFHKQTQSGTGPVPTTVIKRTWVFTEKGRAYFLNQKTLTKEKHLGFSE